MKLPTTRLRISKRQAACLIGFLFAGAAASILSAWAVEVFLSYRDPRTWPETGWSIAFNENRLVYDCTVTSTIGSRQWTIVPNPDSKEELLDSANIVPSWVQRPNSDPDQMVSTCAFGLPFLCMRWYDEIALDPVTRGSRRNTLHFMWKPRALGLWLGWFPLAPYFPGLLLNTLFYSTLFSTPYLLRQTRRHLRLRRGHCPFCNYNLIHNFTHPCPECGRVSATTSDRSRSGAAS